MAGSDAHNRQLFARILAGIAVGVVVGLFFGEAVRPLGIVATGFIRLLQVNVLPYLLGSLIASLGGRESAATKVMAKYGASLLVFVWMLTLVLVLLSPLAFPRSNGTPVFGISEEPAHFDWLELYIPSNLFYALSNNLIPAVVLFGILAGIALGQMGIERKEVLLQALESFNEAMSRVSRMILKLTPIGLFAIAASMAGQIRSEDVVRLQVWLFFYIGGALLLTLWMLPLLVSRFTPVPYVRFLRSMRSAIVTAAAAGDVLVVLPLLAESAKDLLVEIGADAGAAERAVGVAVPLLYNFPHAGKILTLAFLPFASWYAGTSLGAHQLLLLASAGPMSLFGSINAAIPFLLDLLHLPSDLFELFQVSSVVNSRFGSMAAATHTAALSVLVTAAMLGYFRISVVRLTRVIVATLVTVAALVLGTRAVFTWAIPPDPSGLQTLSPFELRPPLVASVRLHHAAPLVHSTGNDRVRDIRARGVLRVGYFADAVPWAFLNAKGELVGYDVEAAHRLATQLNVTLEFVRTDRATIAADLNDGRVDILMTGFVATVSRAEHVELSHPYSNEHLGFLVHDYDRGRFASSETMNRGEGMTIALPPIQEASDVIKRLAPDAKVHVYPNIDDAIDATDVAAVFMTLERAYYWSRIRPEFTAVRPDDLKMATMTVYAMPYGEVELRNLVDLWIDTRQASGEADEAYEYWIRGRALKPREPRWSVLRNVLGWR